MADGIERVGIIGAGTMGTGIATSLAMHGRQVVLTDSNGEAAERALASAEKFYARAVEKQRMGEDDAAAATGRLATATSLGALGACDLVIEAVFEDFDLKARVLNELSRHIAGTTLVATNTSCLRVSDLAGHIAGPERFLGLHYFSPAQINPVVEVVQGEATADATIVRAMEFCASTGKNPIRCKDSFGFAVNRFFCPYTNWAVHALDEGLGTTADIDAVARDVVGAAAGPFLVMNLIKPRINLHAIRNLAPLGSFYAPAPGMVAVGDADRSWEIGEETRISQDARERIADSLLCGVFLPVLQALDEGVAEPAAFDQGARQALRFDKPPCALMRELGADEVARIIAPALRSHKIDSPDSLSRIDSLVV